MSFHFGPPEQTFTKLEPFDPYNEFNKEFKYDKLYLGDSLLYEKKPKKKAVDKRECLRCGNLWRPKDEATDGSGKLGIYCKNVFACEWDAWKNPCCKHCNQQFREFKHVVCTKNNGKVHEPGGFLDGSSISNKKVEFKPKPKKKSIKQWVGTDVDGKALHLGDKIRVTKDSKGSDFDYTGYLSKHPNMGHINIAGDSKSFGISKEPHYVRKPKSNDCHTWCSDKGYVILKLEE